MLRNLVGPPLPSHMDLYAFSDQSEGETVRINEASPVHRNHFCQKVHLICFECVD